VADLLEVRLVADLLTGHEHRQDLAVVDRGVDTDLWPGQVLLDQHRHVVLPGAGKRGVVRESVARGQLVQGVGSDHTQAGGQRARLEHDRIADLLRRGDRLVEVRGQDRLRLRYAGRGQRLPGQPLVSAPHDHVRVAAGQRKRRGHLRALQDARLVPAQHAVDRLARDYLAGRGHHLGYVGRTGQVTEDGEAVEVVELPTRLGAQQQVHPKPGPDRPEQVLAIEPAAGGDQ
jgi:hypothetical protein